jgi:hypothetical protein
VEDGVDPAVAGSVPAVPDGLVRTFGGRRRSGAVRLKRAKPPSVKRRGSPTSTRSSATLRVDRPHS